MNDMQRTVRYEVLQLDDSGEPLRRVASIYESDAVAKIQSVHAWESAAKIEAERIAAKSAVDYPGESFTVRTVVETMSDVFKIPVKAPLKDAYRLPLQTSAKKTGTGR